MIRVRAGTTGSVTQCIAVERVVAVHATGRADGRGFALRVRPQKAASRAGRLLAALRCGGGVRELRFDAESAAARARVVERLSALVA